MAALTPRALVFEMLTPQKAMQTPPDRSDAARLARAFDWQNSGWPDFAMYHPIFAAAPMARIYGGDLPPGDARRAVSEGAAAVFGADAPRHVRDEFYAAVGARDPEAALAYLQLAPVVVWREWALTGVRRPVERGGVAVAGGSEGGAVYLWRLVGREWRLVTVVRSWG